MAYRPWEYNQQLQSAKNYFNNLRTNAGGAINPSTATSSPATPVYYDNNAIDFNNIGDTSTPSATYSDAELADYPSPSWMAPAANWTWGLMTNVANMGIPGLGFALDQGKQAATNPNHSWDTLGRNAVGTGLSSLWGMVNPVNQMTPSIGQIMAGEATGKVGSSLIDKALSYFLGDWGKKGSNKGIGGDWFQGPEPTVDPNTISNMDYDPAAYDFTNLVQTAIGPVSNDTYLSGFNAPPGTYSETPGGFSSEAFGNPSGTQGYEGWTGDTASSNDAFGNPMGAGDNGGGGDGGGGGPGTVICTELNRQGLLPDKVYISDSAYGKTIDRDAYFGYRKLFTPVAKAMAKSKVLTFFLAPIGMATAYEMASRVNDEIEGNIIGKVILAIGIPFCKAYWKLTAKKWRTT